MGCLPIKQPKFLFCQNHNKQAIYIDIKQQDQKKKYLCQFCIQQFPFQTSHSDIYQLLKEMEIENENNISTLINLLTQLQNYKQEIVNIVDQQIVSINQKIKIMKEEFEKSTLQVQLASLDVVKSQYKANQTSYQQFYNQATYQLQQLHQISQCKQLFQTLNQLNFNSQGDKLENLIPLNGVQYQDYQLFNKEIRPENSKCEYQLLQQNSFQQNMVCHALAFNSDNTLIITGCECEIRVFEFQGEKLIPCDYLKGHTNQINCLFFMKKSKQFISGSRDDKIKIWELNYQNKGKCVQTLIGHNSTVLCLTLNENEDLLISCGQNKSIIFWQKQNNQFQLSQTINCSGVVYGLSLNDSNNKLIISQDDQLIQVLQQFSDQWQIIQQIKVQIQGYRICFLSDYQFVYQPFKEKQFQIFNYNQTTNEYHFAQEIQVKNSKQDWYFFPIQCIQTSGIITAKNGKWLNIIRRQRNGEFILDQSIEFRTHVFFGTISNDGQYLITWEQESKNYNIRKLIEIN